MPLEIVADVGLAKASQKLKVPQTAQPLELLWIDATCIVAIHLLALLAFVPWLFSWTGVILALAGFYVFGTLGISRTVFLGVVYSSKPCILNTFLTTRSQGAA